MRKFYLIISFLAFIFIFDTAKTFAGKEIEIPNEFTLFTSKNMQGYLKPFFTSLEESFNSSMFTTANYKKEWSIGMDVSVMGMFIPDDQKTFDAERPQGYGNTDVTNTIEIRNGQNILNATGSNIQPTIYGGLATPIFSVPKSPRNQSYTYNGKSYYDSTIKTVGYVEGNRINFMSGLPVLQFFLGLPTQTQIKFRFFAAPVVDEALIYYGIMVNQRMDGFFDLFNPKDEMAIALNASFHNMSRDAGIDIKSWSFGTHFSKGFGSGLYGYLGLMYEDMSGSMKFVKNPQDISTQIKSPYPEVQQGDPLQFDVESFNKFRFLGGVSYRISFLEIHADAAWASQPILNFGLSFWFGSWGNIEKQEDIQIEKKEKIIK
jgi:hypothetical protein